MVPNINVTRRDYDHPSSSTSQINLTATGSSGMEPRGWSSRKEFPKETTILSNSETKNNNDKASLGWKNPMAMFVMVVVIAYTGYLYTLYQQDHQLAQERMQEDRRHLHLLIGNDNDVKEYCDLHLNTTTTNSTWTQATMESKACQRLVDVGIPVLEYAMEGPSDGNPLLVVTAGDFHHGLWLGRSIVNHANHNNQASPNDFHMQLVVPSQLEFSKRPDISDDLSLSLQSDMHVCLLETLSMDVTTKPIHVLGVMGGALSVLDFSYQSSMDVESLALWSPTLLGLTNPETNRSYFQTHPLWTPLYWASALHSDWIHWLCQRFLPDIVMDAVLGTPSYLYYDSKRPSTDQAYMDILMKNMTFPISSKRMGIFFQDTSARPKSMGFLFESNETNKDHSYQQKAKVHPRQTLVIGHQDDRYGTFHMAEHLAQRIPDAKLLAYPTGGHVGLGHQDEIFQILADFYQTSHCESSGTTTKKAIPSTPLHSQPNGNDTLDTMKNQTRGTDRKSLNVGTKPP